MDPKFYKGCAVPQCGNTTVKTPKKLFIHVPRTGKLRKKWLQLARRDPALVSPQSKMYFCEDHFDLPNDMENYTKYRLMGSISKIQMKEGCLPLKFDCQPDRKGRTGTKRTRSLPAKRQRLRTIEECEIEIEQANSTQSTAIAKVQPGPNSVKRKSITYKKSCAVPHCSSTNIKTAEKLFIHVPDAKNVRKEWLRLAGRDPQLGSTQSKMYFCEDHFDLPNDMENYIEYRVMGSVSQIRMRAGCMPSKFACLQDRKTQADVKTTRSSAKRRSLEKIEECVGDIEEAQSTQNSSTTEVPPSTVSGDSVSLDVCATKEPASWDPTSGSEEPGAEPHEIVFTKHGGDSVSLEVCVKKEPASDSEEPGTLLPHELVFTKHMCIKVEVEFVEQEEE